MFSMLHASHVYLIGSAIKTIKEEIQMSNRLYFQRHLNNSQELLAVQAPQMQQVGASSSCKRFPISVKKQCTLHTCTQAEDAPNAQVIRAIILLCDSIRPVMYSGPILWNRQLILANKSVALPSKNGVIAKAAENGVAAW